MVSNVSAGSKKTPPNIRTPSVHSPVLVSPISVAHRNKMLENEGGNKSNSNWMRDQWVANLKKKQMNGGGSGAVSGVQVTSNVVPSRGAGTGGRTTKSGGRSNSRRSNNNSQQQQQQQNLMIPPLNSHSFGEKDNLGLTHPAMFFNDLGCFEIESQSFTRLTPSTRDFDHLLSTPSDGSMISNSSYSVSPQLPVATTATTTTKSRGGGGSRKNSAKPVPKKRTKCSALDVNQPKPRTPRRKLNCGNAFEDYQDPEVSTSSSSSTPHCFSSVGTPSNFNAEVSRMWGHDLDFSAGSFVDTFLDLPTPKSAEVPITTTMGGHQSQQQQQYQSSSSPVHFGATPPPRNTQQHLDDDLGLPKLIRTTSIEQEGLSHFFEQTTLGGDNNSSSSSHQPSTNNITDLYQMDGCQAPGHHHHQIKKNQIDLGSASGPYGQAAMGAVDECFSKLIPSPHAAAPRRNSLLGSLGSSAAAQFNNLSRLLSSTPRNGQGAQGNLRTPRGPNGEYNFDHKNMPEFETLLDEYKFTDIDQELDSFYLDTIESFGGDLDLISN